MIDCSFLDICYHGMGLIRHWSYEIGKPQIEGWLFHNLNIRAQCNQVGLVNQVLNGKKDKLISVISYTELVWVHDLKSSLV